MKTKTIQLIIGLILISMQLYSKTYKGGNLNSSKNISAYAATINFNYLDSLPDSIHTCGYDDQAIKSVITRQYNLKSNNVLQVKFSNKDYVNYANDFYFYNAEGKLDSSVLESLRDPEYEEYAVKNIYTYSGNLLTREIKLVDQVDNAVNVDWLFTQQITYTYNSNNRVIQQNKQYFYKDTLRNWQMIIYSYDDKNRLKEQITKTADNNGAYKNWERISSSYDETSSVLGIIRTDSVFQIAYDNRWLPYQVLNFYYDANNLCTLKKVMEFSDYYHGNPDSVGVLEGVYNVSMKYDSVGHLLISDLHYTNGTLPFNKEMYEYDSNGNMISETLYQNFGTGWDKLYSYEFFFKQVAVNYVESAERIIKIYPNPVKEKLFIDAYNNLMQGCVLYNSNGQYVKSINLKNGRNVLNVNDLKAGLYFIQMSMQQRIITKKIIKQ